MKAYDFCFWLQGHFELNAGKDELTAEQANTIRNHLALVFQHDIDPSMGSKAEQDKLNSIHTAPFRPNPNPTMRC